MQSRRVTQCRCVGNKKLTVTLSLADSLTCTAALVVLVRCDGSSHSDRPVVVRCDVSSHSDRPVVVRCDVSSHSDRPVVVRCDRSSHSDRPVVAVHTAHRLWC